MQIEIKKWRCRTDVNNSAVKSNVSDKKGQAPAVTKLDVVSDNCDNLCEMPSMDLRRPLGIFEFPWQKEEGALEPELEGCNFTDVFFSSLVDGCSAINGIAGDRLSRPIASPIILPEASTEDPEDNDCIWSSILLQPLGFVYSTKNSGG